MTEHEGMTRAARAAGALVAMGDAPPPGLLPVLCWERPPQKEDPEARAEYWGGGIPGAYAPNMDAGWMGRWKAKMTGTRGAVLEVEVRKTTCITRGSSVQVLIRVGEDGSVVMSMNGTASFTPAEFGLLHIAVAEARDAMDGWRAEHPLSGQAAQ